MDAYDTVYLGYPNWWGTCPMAVFSFLEGFDAAGKRILPFCTHEGSAMGNSERDIRKACPEAKVLPGLAIQGGHITHADGVIAQWVGGGN